MANQESAINRAQTMDEKIAKYDEYARSMHASGQNPKPPSYFGIKP